MKVKSNITYYYALQIFRVRLIQAREQKVLLKDKRINKYKASINVFSGTLKVVALQEAHSFRSSFPKQGLGAKEAMTEK